MPTCLSGHDSASTEFCDVCGMRMTGAGSDLAAPDPDQAAAPGTDVAAAPAAGWAVVVTADRAYYDSVIAQGGPDAASIEFPWYCAERRFPLNGREMRIGRRSVSRGLAPEIDLTGPPADPGVSHMHAVLIAEPDGAWGVLDPGSANGTIVNGGEIVAGVRVPLHDGDRICLGAWTVLTIQAPPAS
jgi:FHA domain